MMSNENAADTGPGVSPPGIPGHWVVLAMFAFAIVLTGLLWTYTRMHNAPFIPLRRALAEEFTRAAAPRVEGGRHRDGPMILRIILKVEFPLNEKSPEVEERINRMTSRIIELAREHTNLPTFEKLDVFFIHDIPEGAPERREIHFEVAEIVQDPAPPDPVPK